MLFKNIDWQTSRLSDGKMVGRGHISFSLYRLQAKYFRLGLAEPNNIFMRRRPHKKKKKTDTFISLSSI